MDDAEVKRQYAGIRASLGGTDKEIIDRARGFYGSMRPPRVVPAGIPAEDDTFKYTKPGSVVRVE
jgi:hypothetical protein